MSTAIELKNISKTFGRIKANSDVSMKIYRGEILSVLGENGSGKTTLMNMIAGIYFPDSGQIFINGKEEVIRSPRDAFSHKIGMVHQHFKLVDLFTATENIVLGLEEERYNLKQSAEKIKEICDRYGFVLDPDKKIYDMSVSEKQTVEIIKVLYRGADILILDEPTAVLTPQETRNLFEILKKMRQDGKSIIIITHKLREVIEISDRVSVLRRGHYIDSVKISDMREEIRAEGDLSEEEIEKRMSSKLTELMVGKAVDLNIERTEARDGGKRLEVKDLTVVNHDGVAVLSGVSFTANGGEILGVAGISGNGQKELLEAIAGLQKVQKGSITYFTPSSRTQDGKLVFYPGDEDAEVDLRDKNPIRIKELGVRLSFVPEDRLGMGLVSPMSIVDNVMLRSYNEGKSLFLRRSGLKKVTEKIVEDLEVVTPSIDTAVGKLSGGNVQKILVGRELLGDPTVLMMAYPTRGLDINSSMIIFRLLNEQKDKNSAVIYVGEDLDVLVALCDRILVLCGGKVAGIVDARTTNKEEIGRLMTAHGKEDEHNE